jgi:hypothetical protein
MKKGLVLTILFAWWLEIYTLSPGGAGQPLRKSIIGPYVTEAACQEDRNEKAKILGVAVGRCYDDSEPPGTSGAEGPRR